MVFRLRLSTMYLVWRRCGQASKRNENTPGLILGSRNGLAVCDEDLRTQRLYGLVAGRSAFLDVAARQDAARGLGLGTRSSWRARVPYRDMRGAACTGPGHEATR